MLFLNKLQTFSQQVCAPLLFPPVASALPPPSAAPMPRPCALPRLRPQAPLRSVHTSAFPLLWCTPLKYELQPITSPAAHVQACLNRRGDA